MALKCYNKPMRKKPRVFTCKDVNRILIRTEGVCPDVERVRAVTDAFGITDVMCLVANVWLTLDFFKVPYLLYLVFSLLKDLLLLYNIVKGNIDKLLKVKLLGLFELYLGNSIIAKNFLQFAALAASLDALLATMGLFFGMLNKITPSMVFLSSVCSINSVYGVAERAIDVGLDQAGISDLRSELEAARAANASLMDIINEFADDIAKDAAREYLIATQGGN